MRKISKLVILTAVSVLVSQALSAACPGFPRNNSYSAYEHPVSSGYDQSYQQQPSYTDYQQGYQSAPSYQDNNYQADAYRNDSPMYRDNRPENYSRDGFRSDMRGDVRSNDNFRNDNFRNDGNMNRDADFDQTPGFRTDMTNTPNQPQGMRR